MERFSRTELLLGKEKLVKLQNSTICVIGLGAVGCYALEGLARAGVGSFILVDFDFIRPSNINRQILALESTLNIPKVMAAEERVKNINPDATVRTFQFFIDAESIKSVLALKPDIIIDAIDSLNPKSQLITAVYKSGIQIISSMGAATRIDPGKIRIADLMDTKVCPLAASLRRTLKEAGVGRGVQCVYSEEAKNVHAVSKDPIHDPNEFSRGRARNRLGSLSTITGIFGLTIANEAILTLVRTK